MLVVYIAVIAVIRQSNQGAAKGDWVASRTDQAEYWI